MATFVGAGDLPMEAECQDRIALIVEVDDIDAKFKNLSKLGTQVVLEPVDFVDFGFRDAYLRDPDGNLIEMTGALDRSK
jgi:predicted enzyme related to lactoylglutathione lyase